MPPLEYFAPSILFLMLFGDNLDDLFFPNPLHEDFDEIEDLEGDLEEGILRRDKENFKGEETSGIGTDGGSANNERVL